jgi:hypothetical protein
MDDEVGVGSHEETRENREYKNGIEFCPKYHNIRHKNSVISGTQHNLYEQEYIHGNQ